MTSLRLEGVHLGTCKRITNGAICRNETTEHVGWEALRKGVVSLSWNLVGAL
jgi:hypothetical protein